MGLRYRRANWAMAAGGKRGRPVGDALHDESKMLPTSVLNRKVNEKAEHYQRTEGRKAPARRRRKSSGRGPKLDRPAMAFTKRGAVASLDCAGAVSLVLWIPVHKAISDEIVTLLVEGLPGFAVALLDTQTSPAGRHGALVDDAGAARRFSIDREVRAPRPPMSQGRELRYARHLPRYRRGAPAYQAWQLPTKLAMTWDDRVKLCAQRRSAESRRSRCGAVMDGNSQDDGGFDTDVAVLRAELSRLDSRSDRSAGEERTGLGDGLPASLSSTPAAETLPVRWVQDAVRDGHRAGHGAADTARKKTVLTLWMMWLSTLSRQ